MCDQKNGGDHGKMLHIDDVDELSASDESEPEEQTSTTAFDVDCDVDDDDVNDDDGDNDGDEVSAPAAGHRAQSAFSLKGGNQAFSNRSHSIFECLDSVSQLASSSLKQDNITDRVFAHSLSSRPNRKTSMPPPSCPTPAKKRGVPDYLVHPERWTHYSLEDVNCDESNSKIAHQFLSSLQQRKEQQESRTDPDSNNKQKIIFSKPSKFLVEQPANQLSAVENKEQETCLSHLKEDSEDEEAGRSRKHQSVDTAVEKDKDMGGAVAPTEEMKEKMEEANPAFSFFRKTTRKNYRKNSGQEDN
ncbi:U5 small nuclear ribonucleoprotein TSSC4 [Centropristis striata]|uniref:U5 small nuclear ribonucleoprotein TSSC4 n=1 Tax=Centropristis striata TaxID=184440 RepID=UPI0027E1E1A0|nr:U5 small nuclear ribonucleoprotein TSSC4 [Centropristis striata]